MVKRIKKPTVKIEMAREWLRLQEEEGVSAEQIAAQTYHNIRTVRKQIQRARGEKEIREARQHLLLSKLEKHHDDLISFATSLRDIVNLSKPEIIPIEFPEDPKWFALRQHLPRISIWRDLARWDNLVADYREIGTRLRERIRHEVNSASPLPFTDKPDQQGLFDGIIEAILFNLYHKAIGEKGLDDIEYDEIEIESGTLIERGAFRLALVAQKRVKEIKPLIDQWLSDSLKWEESKEFLECRMAMKKTSTRLKDELNKIILRRMLPGQCDYCPFY